MNNRPYISKKAVLVASLILGFFFIYPNIAKLLQGKSNSGGAGAFEHAVFFVFRYLYFSALCYLLLTRTIRLEWKKNLVQRATWSFGVTAAAFILYLLISFILNYIFDYFSVILIFQFMSIWVICTLMGYAYTFYAQKLIKEAEVEQLKLDSLRSQYAALNNQINPHFFFNSLNTLSALVRKENNTQTLSYIQNLSRIFRYILNSENKRMVTLDEELTFLNAFIYILNIRYGEYISFHIDIHENEKERNIPVLSLLPIVENIPKHNVIDSVQNMEVFIHFNDQNELVVSHPIQPKIDTTTVKHGIGLKNLNNRFKLLLNRKITIQKDDGYFTVRLPLD